MLVLYPNKTWVLATTGHDGEAHVDLYITDLPMKVYIAAPGYAAYREERWMLADGALIVELDPLPKGVP